ncbi:conjugal transfer protein TraI [Nonomuraea dietziae]|uniref:Conjugal transfer protein TraI n=1 Tax=Nonomuraea dietziae TaxID=65515 RepID=A0A7W5YA42_9ACTN|nr:conjugal transfer protein TraI [Nonomuraea dietziae]MBB3730071.1 hypothetical protein [Nonomuraea dietziae]
MSAINPDPIPEPTPEEVARGLAELERHVASQAPAAPSPAELPGATRRVLRLRAEVAEAHQLADLQADDTPLMLDTPKVRKRRKQAQEAARLHALAQDPQMRAWQAARMRRLLVSVAMVVLALSLAWSTAGVQQFAAEGAPAWSPAWLFAWLVEPFMSLALLVVVGARAYMGTRGQPITNRILTRIEGLFLALTFGMNAWPHLPWSLPEGETFTVGGVVLHIIGPTVAVAIVTALPIILAAFANLDHGTRAPLTGLTYGGNAGVSTALIERARTLIASGELPAEPSAYRLQRTLGCAMDDARAVRDALRNDPTTGKD